MKTKKTLISVFALCTAFMLTACGGKDTVSTEKPQDIQTEASTEKPQDVQTEVGTEKPQDVQAEAGTEKPQDVQAEAGTESTDASSTKLDDLYQQENQLFADHADVWNKVFGTLAFKNCRSFFYSGFVSVEGFCVDTYDFTAHGFDCIV